MGSEMCIRDSLYSALKAGVTHFTRMSGVELGPFNIRVNSISPGAIATPIFYGGSARANTLSDEENENKMKKLKNKAIAMSTWLGGVCCVPIACRKIDKTIIILVKEVMPKTSDGRTVKAVISARICNERE